MSSANGEARQETAAPTAGALHHETGRHNPLLVIWRRRWIIVICTLLSLFGAILFLKNATPIYQSDAKVYISQGPTRMIVDPTGMAIAGSQNFLQTQCGLIRSQAILEMVAAEPGIRDLQSFPQGVDSVNRLRDMVTATVGRRDDLITVSVRSPFPKDAAMIANAVVVAFTKYHESESRSATRELLDLLQNKKVEIDRELDSRRQAMLEFKIKNANFSFAIDRVSPTLERVSKLASTLTDMQLNTLNALSAFETAKSMMDDPIKARQLLETRQFKSETVQLRAELRDMQQRLSGLSKSYLPGFPELTSIQNGIKQLQNEMADEDRRIIEAYVAELDAQVQADRRNEKEIETLLNQQRMEVIQFNTVAAQYEKLQDELDRAKRTSDSLNDRIKQFSMAEDASGLKVSPLESAVAHYTPVEPDASATLSYALVLGAMVGIGLAFVRDWLDQRLHSAEEVKQALAVPVLGAVPHITGSVTPSQRGMYLHAEPMSDVAEAYRTIRTAVYFGNDGAVAKTLLITSPAPGDGKTTLASNLAIAMAQAGNRILLLDADFRKPTQHKIFGIEKRLGLSNVLAGESKLEEVIHHSVIPGLDILPCGPIPGNPSEILNSQMFADLLEHLSERYDHVLLDSPPILPVTDSRILAASCDVTLLALRAHRTTLKGALHTRDILNAVGGHVLGVVVNDIPRRRGLYGYYYGYGEAYQYGYGQARRPKLASPADGNGAAKQQA